MIIQIYAFAKIEIMLQAVAAGVDQIGFIAGIYDLVHGELDFRSASTLAREVPKPAKSVALTMSTDINEILRMAELVHPDILHISSETDAVGIDQMAEIRARLDPTTQLMKAIAVADQNSIDTAVHFASVSDILLLDTKAKGFPGVGATGKTHDWKLSREIVARSPVSVILAGGLNAQNVRSAIQSVNPWGVDSNTSTNIPGDPLVKDIVRIQEFVKAVRIAGKAETL
ncbi:MAG: phosphoribosylanthranilate isomerase [Anaerolineaceae bacterium]